MSSKELSPNILYHYTTQAGLLGILKEKALWVTNVNYLNDKSEFVYALKIIREEAIKRINQYRDKQESFQKIFRAITSELQEIDPISSVEFYVNNFLKSMVPVYVCSFSKEGDQLGQWRGYCHNESGYSIGFNFSKLLALSKEQYFTLSPCIYDLELQEPILNDLTDLLFKNHLSKIDKKEAINWLIKLWSTAPTIKDNNFIQEAEWRLISGAGKIADKKIFFRPGKSMIIPYIKFELGNDLPIDEIIVGATPNENLAKDSLSFIKIEYKLSNTKIKNSSVPSRTW